MAPAISKYDVIRVSEDFPEPSPEEYGTLTVRCEGEYLATAADLAHAQEIIADETGVAEIELQPASDDGRPHWVAVAVEPQLR